MSESTARSHMLGTAVPHSRHGTYCIHSADEQLQGLASALFSKEEGLEVDPGCSLQHQSPVNWASVSQPPPGGGGRDACTSSL